MATLDDAAITHRMCGQGAVSRPGSISEPCAWEFSRDFISLPLLKKGTALRSTETRVPVRGFRPVRPSRNFTKNTPNPRSSTRSPRAIAAVITEKMVLMIFSASCRYRCGFWTEIRSMSSDLITVVPPRVGRSQVSRNRSSNREGIVGNIFLLSLNSTCVLSLPSVRQRALRRFSGLRWKATTAAERWAEDGATLAIYESTRRRDCRGQPLVWPTRPVACARSSPPA